MIDAYQDWAEGSRMRINHEKTEVMMFYETPPQRATRFPSTFHITTRFPLSQPPQTLSLKEPCTFKYLVLTLNPYLTMEAAMKHTYQKINAGAVYVHVYVRVVPKLQSGSCCDRRWLNTSATRQE